MPNNPRFSPEEALRRMSFLAALKELLESTAGNMDLISAEEVLEICKETALFSASFFVETTRNSLSVNPTLRIGETNTSSDKTVAGTVDSQRYFSRRPFPVGIQIADKVKEYFQKSYLELSTIQKAIVAQDYKSLSGVVDQGNDNIRALEKHSRAVRKNRNLSYMVRKAFKANQTKSRQNKGKSARRTRGKRQKVTQ